MTMDLKRFSSYTCNEGLFEYLEGMKILKSNKLRNAEFHTATRWLEEGSESGSFLCDFALGECLIAEDCDVLGEAPERLGRAFPLILKHATLGCRYCQYCMGLYNINPALGQSIDRKRAFEWFLKSAEQGLSWAQQQVSICYFHGWGVKQSLEKSAEWIVEFVTDEDAYAEEIYTDEGKRKGKQVLADIWLQKLESYV